MSDDYGTIPMFEVPDRYRKARPENAAPKWGKHSGPRTTCELCILDIRAGHLRSPYETATETYTVGSRVWHLCATHRTQIKYQGREMPA